MDIFYHLTDPTQSVPEADDDWENELKEKNIICSACRSIRQPASTDVFLKERIYKYFSPITYASPVGIGMIRKDIVSLIGLSKLETAFYIGKVYDVTQKQSEQYISLVPKFQVYIRGGEESTCRICEKCGKILYFPLPLNKWYLTKDKIPANDVFSSNFSSGIIVSESIYQVIKQSGIKTIGYEKLPVLSKTIDNYDEYFVNL